MAPPPKKEPRTGFFASPRKILYAFTFGLIGACTAVELGLVSQQLHHYGNFLSRYPTQEYKSALDLLLFACLWQLLIVIFHYQLPSLLVAFATLSSGVFWGAGAGIIERVSPFEFYNCGEPASYFNSIWAPFKHECARIVTIQGFGWTLWALSVFLLLGIIVDNVEFHVKTRPFYPLTDEEKA
ncbi:hypothetical protein CPB83DRAFT_595361 [Crepidotus variabilis]|uniref:Uncharacterized protein n=1 Tax=Crepidotus variabilis TaxID=179855 RepID=A0A9P6E992_9AGAR|nr:hypothetical protein CPB83DRAFT_595361 [Crepidotus variabilis]